MGCVNHINVFDGEEGESQHAIVQGFAGQFVRVGDSHQVDVTNLAHRFAHIGFTQFNLINALEFGNVMKAIGALLTFWAGFVQRAFAIVALDDQACFVVNHVEVANRMAGGLHHVLPVATRPLL